MACKLSIKSVKIAAKRKLLCSSIVRTSEQCARRSRSGVNARMVVQGVRWARGQQGPSTERGASLPPTPSRGSRGSRGPREMGRGEAHPGDAAVPTPDRAQAGRAPTALGSRAAAGPRTPGAARAGRGAAPGRQPLSDRALAPSGTRQRLRASRALRGWRRGWEGPGTRGGPARRPWGSGEGRAGDYLRGGGGARRVTGGDSGLLPTAGPRSPVGLVGGVARGVPESPLLLPSAVAGLGVRGVLFAHFSLACRRWPR